jgi:hypothetical protein
MTLGDLCQRVLEIGFSAILLSTSSRSSVTSSRLKIVRARSFDWDDFDRIYQVAATSFDELRDNLPA